MYVRFELLSVPLSERRPTCQRKSLKQNILDATEYLILVINIDMHVDI